MTIAISKCKDCKEKSCAVAILNDEELALLSGNISEVEFEKGETLFKEESLNSHVVYLKQGLVKVHVKIADDKDFILKIVPAPSYLGLPSLFGDRVSQYSATALDYTKVCFIDVNIFKHLINTNGKFAYEIIADISQDELCTFRRYVNLTHKQTPGRLAGALLFFAREIYHNNRFSLPLTRKELAEMIGASRENVTRNLGQFRNDGIIDIDKHIITILKPDVLERINQAG